MSAAERFGASSCATENDAGIVTSVSALMGGAEIATRALKRCAPNSMRFTPASNINKSVVAKIGEEL